MNRFYFNECLPNAYDGSVQDIFNTTIRAYNRIVKDPTLNIEEGIITHKIPSEILVCGVYLKNIIDSCNDKELRKVAYHYFNKYPIDTFYDLEDIFDTENIDLEYCYDEKDATNLIIAHKMGWVILSLPLCASLMTDMLQINSDENHTFIDNWYGTNTQYIVKCIAERRKFRQAKVLELRYCFGDKNCLLSDSFVNDYIYSPTDLQEFIIEKFMDALSANLLFPARYDNNLVKVCKGLGNEGTYELRSNAFGGLRVYFSCDEGCLYIGGMGTKSSSIGKEQSADISRASNEIFKLKSL